MSRALPFSFLFFRAKGSHKNLLRFVRRVNSVLDKGGNMLLLSPAVMLKDVFGGENTAIITIPCYFGFPFVLWPLHLIPRLIYTLGFIVRGRAYSVRMRPISARVVAATYYEARK